MVVLAHAEREATRHATAAAVAMGAEAPEVRVRVEKQMLPDAVDENGGNVGTGCAPGQQVLEKELSQIRVVVSAE